MARAHVETGVLGRCDSGLASLRACSSSLETGFITELDAPVTETGPCYTGVMGVRP